MRKKAREGKILNEQEHKLLSLTGLGAVTGLPMKEIGEGLPDLPDTNQTTLEVGCSFFSV